MYVILRNCGAGCFFSTTMTKNLIYSLEVRFFIPEKAQAPLNDIPIVVSRVISIPG